MIRSFVLQYSLSRTNNPAADATRRRQGFGVLHYDDINLLVSGPAIATLTPSLVT